jgi:hypothetical protein
MAVGEISIQEKKREELLMIKRIVVCLAFAGIAVASAKSYSVKFFVPVTVGGTELKPGEYKVEVVGDKAVIRRGQINVESPVKVVTVERAFPRTSMRLAQNEGKMRIQEIRLGGEKTRLVFTE